MKSGNSLRDRAITIGVTPTDEKMRESCLRWFGHMQTAKEINQSTNGEEWVVQLWKWEKIEEGLNNISRNSKKWHVK